MSRSPVKYKSLLQRHIDSFVAYKRALGRKFDTEERALHLLDRYLVEHRVRALKEITPKLLDAFMVSRPRLRPLSYNNLLCAVRRLFNWMVVQGVLARSPLQAAPRRNIDPRRPFIFDANTTARLLELAGHLPHNPRCPRRAETYRTIFALLYGLGLRAGEVSRLQMKDVDFNRQLLVIRDTKFNKSRLIPFGARISALLQNFLRMRTQAAVDLGPDAPVFSLFRGKPLPAGTISMTFHHLIPQLQLDIPPGVASPRLHDLRHSFAVGTLLRWYRAGVDVGARLLKLSTFLGHVHVAATAVYLTITDALLHEANCRYEAFARPALTEGTQP